MNIYRYPAREEWAKILGRQKVGPRAELKAAVEEIIEAVRARGDEAVVEFELKFDGFAAAGAAAGSASGAATDAADSSGAAASGATAALRVTPAEIAAAGAAVPEDLKSAILAAADNIRKFHAAQMPEDISVETTPGVVCSQINLPLQTVGLYIPGGTAPLFSTVLMLAIPAKIAGVDKTVLCTPPRKDGTVSPIILYAAQVCGVDEIYKVGGAVAVAAMAYGTVTIPRVDKIFGPGNSYVMEAKQQVSHICAIDMPAGPSEVLVMADDSAEPDFVCADFLSQLEHGRDSQSIVLTDSETLAQAVSEALPKQAAALSRMDYVEQSLLKSMIVILRSKAEMIEFSNFYAPEHLIISTSDCLEILGKIRNAGSVFLGNFSPESAGDYASGTNHTLPTSGWAASYSGVNLASYMKKMTVQEITPDGLRRLAPVIESMAQAEGLDAHANAVKIRLRL